MSELSKDGIIDNLSSYFSQRKDIAFAVLFGSFARDETRKWSDLDVAVYFYPKDCRLELEDETFYEAEDQIWSAIEKLSGFEVDLLVMNRAPARIVYSAVCEGEVLAINNRKLYLRVLLASGSLFDEYADFTESYLTIKARSRSISEIDKDRLMRIIDFLETELGDSSQFQNISYQIYIDDSAMRRNLERWIENLVNTSIDAAKIIVASKKQHIPQTYRESIERLKTMPGFQDNNIDALARNTTLRNVLAHEYIDIRFTRIKKFLETAEEDYKEFIKVLKRFYSSFY